MQLFFLSKPKTCAPSNLAPWPCIPFVLTTLLYEPVFFNMIFEAFFPQHLIKLLVQSPQFRLWRVFLRNIHLRCHSPMYGHNWLYQGLFKNLNQKKRGNLRAFFINLVRYRIDTRWGAIPSWVQKVDGSSTLKVDPLK